MKGKGLVAVVAAAATALALLAPVPAGAAPMPASAADGRADLPDAWQTSGDLAWTTSGDATGLHLLVAEARTGYTWRTVATLAEDGFETDQWVGNACLTASSDQAVVVYAPRAFTNKESLARRGAFASIVNIRTGAVTRLKVTASLAYFNPGCGAGETAVLTQEGDEDLGATRLVRLDAASGRLDRPVRLTGQVTSAVPVGGDIVAVSGHRLIRVGADGQPATVVTAAGLPAYLRADRDGGVTYLDRTRNAVRVRRTVGRATTVLAEGSPGAVGLRQGSGGRVFLTGELSRVAKLPNAIQRLAAPVGAEVSTEGTLALTSVVTRNAPLTTGVATRWDLDDPQPATIRATVIGTGRTLAFTVDPEASLSSPAAGGATTGAGVSVAAAGSPSSPVDTDRWCSIARNDVRTMAYQPTPRQVEWAVDLAVQYALTVRRPAGFKGFGLPEYSPQGLFPPPAAGGVHVPPQIFLGILAQESNLWQATGKAQSGEYGNPLTGNVYGLTLDDETGEIQDWVIHWDKSDCGYGISQRTDGMRMAGHPKDGEVILSATQQRAVALDYAANIAAGLSLVQDKWNQVTEAGMTLNDGDSHRIENWYYAAWAYNSGFHKQSDAAQNHGVWGLGWFNNPANPRYDPVRHPFLFHNSWADAAHPERWPYPEKVLGFASYAIDTPDGPGFRPAWWLNDNLKDTATPPHTLFCDSSNDCDPFSDSGDDGGPCLHQYNGQYDSYCWYTKPATWRTDCPTQCGHELIRFDPSYPEQPDGTHYPPQCTMSSGLPSGALVIDDIPGGTPTPRCGTSSSAGSFSFSFEEDPAMPGTYPGKIDLHQLDGGHGGHFWFAHTREPGYRDKLKVTGTWTLGRTVDGWARVLVRIPDHGAHTRQARYALNDELNSYRMVPQRTQANRWISLGVFRFIGVAPTVSLSTQTFTGFGTEDIAWDAIAVQPLSAKPRNFVVALGDSYSSGEGASVTGGGDYYKESDVDGGDPEWRNACHRSRWAWSRRAALADSAQTLGERADGLDNSTDYHLIACSWAETENVLPAGVSNAFGNPGGDQLWGEVSQLDQGYLDKNTTLVTVSIGGNDARFREVLTHCVTPTIVDCQSTILPGDNAPLASAEPSLIHTKVRSSITTVLTQIHSLAPNAKIVLMGYPLLMESGGGCIPSIPMFDVQIRASEAAWLNDMGNVLAQEMNGAAVDATNAGARTWFSDPRDEFAGQGICGNPETVHGLVTDRTPGDDPSAFPPFSAQTFHPKIEGTANYARSLNTTLRAMGL